MLQRPPRSAVKLAQGGRDGQAQPLTILGHSCSKIGPKIARYFQEVPACQHSVATSVAMSVIEVENLALRQ
jgi:hypothetical protein